MMNSADRMRLDVLALHNGLTSATLAARTPTPHRQALRMRCWLRWGLRCPGHQHRQHRHLDAGITPRSGWWAVFMVSGLCTELFTMGGPFLPARTAHLCAPLKAMLRAGTPGTIGA